MQPLQIVLHTPIWVFGLLALLIWLGVQSMLPRQVRVQRLFIVPAVFIAWGLLRLASGQYLTQPLLVDWAAGAVIGGLIGALTARVGGIQVDLTRRRVHLPGDWVPLVRNLAIFTAKYALAAILAVQPALRDQLVSWDFAVSGAAAGYFLGWLVRFVAAYNRAPRIAPAAA